MNRADAIPGQLSFSEIPASDDPAGDVPASNTGPTDATGPAPGLPVAGSISADAGPWSPAPGPRRPGLTIDVVRSTRRSKTAQARLRGSRLEIRIPARCSRAEEAELVRHFRAKFERVHTAEGIDLTQRATDLADRYRLPRPTSIRWVSNQEQRWGSCTPDDGTIRLSDRMAGFPTWVIDYVIVHELAHLVEAAHSPAFWQLVEAYPLTERARGFLMAKAWED